MRLIVQLRAAVFAAIVFSGYVLPSLLSAQVPLDSAAVPLAPDTSGAVAVADSTLTPRNCGHTRQEVQLRRAGVAGVFIGGNAALYSYMKSAWWTGERSDGFFFNADWDENFRDQDKFGHALGGYHLARFGAAFFRSACMSKPKATALSAAYAALFQLQIEIFDAQFEKYGFSYPDLLANTIGTGLAVLHETFPRTRAIKPLISYAPTKAYRNRANFENELRPSLDYSGQTYWLTADVNAMLPPPARGYWPAFLRVSAGHSITDWIDPRTGANIRAKRKIVLTIDFDAEKLPGENRIWKTFKRQVSYIHLPSPALQISPNLELIGWYR